MFILGSFSQYALATEQCVDVKYQGRMTLEHFECQKTNSSLVKAVCYNGDDDEMLLKLQDHFYLYCNMKDARYSDFMNAQSLGRYFVDNIKNQNQYLCARRSTLICNEN
jgi:hypothetical protein